SLRIEDLDRLRNEFTFVHNKIYLAFDETPWRPSYYNVEDYKVIDQNHKVINELRGFPKLLYSYRPGIWIRDEWTIEYDLFPPPDEHFPRFSENPFRGLYCGWSVCYSSMQWAWFMGFRQIYLLGIDFSFVIPNVDAKGEIVSDGEPNHFFDQHQT